MVNVQFSITQLLKKKHPQQMYEGDVKHGYFYRSFTMVIQAGDSGKHGDLNWFHRYRDWQKW